MGRLRFPLLATLAACLAGCVAATPLQPAQDSVATTQENGTSQADESDRPPTAEEPANEPVEHSAKAEIPAPPLPSPKPDAASNASRANATTPKVGSAEWKKERAEDARKEKHLKEVIENICRGC
jgi:hypothetical protein